MKKEPNHIECPHCSGKIDVNEIVYNQITEEIKKDFVKKVSEEKKEQEIKIRNEISEELNTYKEELETKTLQLKDLNKTKAELERTKREKRELREQIEAESELKFSQLLNSERERMRSELDEKSQLKVAEKEFVINQLKEQLSEAQRKAEQGSMQIQGEVQEVLIEEWLKNNFPLDIICEIKKGARGADCLQIVNSRRKQNCGSIYFESKRTRDFQNSWIEKFKTDMREKNATFGVLVTDVFPKGIDRMTQIEGVWICSVSEFRSLCFVLRESVILLDENSSSQENKGDKMQMLYDYLCGKEFRQQIEIIVESFSIMQEDLFREQRAMAGLWKKRQKSIDKVLLGTTHMFNTVKGIAGDSISSIKQLELPDNKENNIE